jgi:sugar O-acyltransferase (sialic acid O-acetyltransferase NeuD family)
VSIKINRSRSVAIVGAGALGRLAVNILQLNKQKIHGFFDDNLKTGTIIDGIEVRGPLAQLSKDKGKFDLVIGVGDVKIRKRIFEDLSAQGFNFATVIHPSACVAATSVVGQGCLIKDNAVVEINAQIGVNSIIGNCSIICHDTQVGSHCRVSPGVVVAGFSRIGDECYLAPNVSVDRKITIGRQSIIASGCTIWKNIPESSLVKLPQEMNVHPRSLS